MKVTRAKPFRTVVIELQSATDLDAMKYLLREHNWKYIDSDGDFYERLRDRLKEVDDDS